MSRIRPMSGVVGRAFRNAKRRHRIHSSNDLDLGSESATAPTVCDGAVLDRSDDDSFVTPDTLDRVDDTIVANPRRPQRSEAPEQWLTDYSRIKTQSFNNCCGGGAHARWQGFQVAPRPAC